MEAKWTPGPWKAFHSDFYSCWCVAPDWPAPEAASHFEWGEIARVEFTYADDEATARLMAASPDLYAALAKLTEVYVQLVGSGDCGFWNPEEDPEVIAARAALAKASDGGA